MGEAGTHLGQSLYLREILGREDGPPPPVDLHAERENGTFVRKAIEKGLIAASHDLSDGGLAVALAEMCLASDVGAVLELESDQPHAALFGEDQARYLLCVEPDLASGFTDLASSHGVNCRQIGQITGNRLEIGDVIAISMEELRSAHESWFPAFMDGDQSARQAAE